MIQMRIRRLLFPRSNKAMLAIAVIFSILYTVAIVSVSAWSYQTISVVTDYFTHPQLASAVMPNGKFVYVLGKQSAENSMYVYCYGADGSLDATTIVDITGNNYCFDGAWSVRAMDDDNAIIFYMTVESGGTRSTYGVVVYNTNTFATTQHNSGDEGTTLSASTVFRAGQIYEVDGDFYFLGTYTRLADAGSTDTVKMCYEPDTDNFYFTRQHADDDEAGYTFGFVDENEIESDGDIYLITGKHGTPTYARLYKWDVQTWNSTNEPELLCEMGNARWSNAHGDAVQSADLTLRYGGGGLVYNATTTDYYLYHTWGLCETSSYVSGIQHRVRFNGTGIDADYLEAQDELRVEYELDNPAETPVHLVVQHNQTDFTVYAQDFEEIAIPWDYNGRAVDFSIMGDWYDFGTAFITGVGGSFFTEDIVLNQKDNVYKHGSYTWATGEKSDDTEVYIFYGLSTQSSDWEIENWGYTPAHDPPYTHTRYLFSGTTTNNGVGTQSIITVWFDDAQIYGAETDINGGFSFNLLTTIAGTHDLDVGVYALDNQGTAVLMEYYDYIFQTTEADEESQLGATSISTIIQFSPIMIIMLAPAMAIMKLIGRLGFFVGLILGAIVATMAGIMPTYGLLMIVFLTALAFTFFGGRR